MSTADLFNRLAARYDAWYEGPAGAAVFPAEVACLRPLLDGLPRVPRRGRRWSRSVPHRPQPWR